MATNVVDEILIGKLANHQPGMAEISQTKSLRFAFISPSEDSKKFIPFHPLVKCRDFLNDIIQATFLDEEIHIYGLNLNPSDLLLNEEQFHMLLSFPDEEHASIFDRNFPFILEKEYNLFGLPPSELYSVKNKPTQLVIKADKYWQSTTYLTSLYTYMCRCSLYLRGPEEDWFMALPEDSVDGRYMLSLTIGGFGAKLPLLPKLSIERAPTPSGLGKNVSLDNTHEYGGVLSLIRGFEPYGEKNFFVQELRKLCAKAA